MANPTIDPYIIDSLMPDLAGHDQRPSAFILYLALWRIAADRPGATVHASLQQLTSATGLSRSTIQHALTHLAKRQLISTRRASPTAIPQHTVLRPWATRRRSP